MSAHELLRRAADGDALKQDERFALAQWLLGEPSQRGFFGLAAADAGQAVGERLRWLPAAWATLADCTVDAAGYPERVRCTSEELFLFRLPLVRRLLLCAGEARGRCLVAVAGLPAGGKSVFAAVAARLAAAMGPPFEVAVAGLDGYHYPNAWLLSHRTPPGLAEQGPLKLYKGAELTFNAARLAGDLRRLRESLEAVSLPAYDRTLHDPVEGRVRVGPEVRLVLVEGNYLLYRGGDWAGVGDAFDLRIFLDLPPGANRERMIARHVRGGKSRQEAERHWERSDRPNTDLVAATRAAADIVVGLDGRYAVHRIAAGSRD